MKRVVVTCLLLCACAAPTPPPAGGPAPAAAGVPPPLVAALPLPDDAVANAVGRLDGLVEDVLRKSGVPGLSVAVVHGGRTTYARGFGVKDNRRPTADAANRVDADTVFQLASLSKSLAATVVAHQVGIGAVTWATRVIDELPWFALSDPTVTREVAVGDLLSHRSGLPDHAGDLLEDLGYDRRYVLDHLRDYPLEPFRISYAYTNYGFTAGAEAVAAGSGKTWEDLSRDVLYQPLGMASTSSRFDDYLRQPNRAIGHLWVDGKFAPDYVRNAQPQSPAGGVSSSANDMARWLAMLLANGTYDGKQVAAAAALLPALTPQVVSSPASEPAARTGFYGYGFNVGTTSSARQQLSHSGAFELGAGTNFVVLPAADVAIVALTNGTPTGAAETLTAEFADLVQFGEVREDWWTAYHDAFTAMERPTGSLAGKQPPANPRPPAPLASYVGDYANPFWGAARITERDGALQLGLGPSFAVPLTHWDGNVFRVGFVSENSPPGSASTATFDGNTLRLEYWDADGRGTFTR